jgi:hypothetical protein
MTPMSPASLRTLIDTTISGITPRVAFGDADGFAPYVVPAQGRRAQSVNAGPPAPVSPATRAQRTRRYRLELGSPTARRGDGLWGFGGAEHDVLLRVLVDYAARAADDSTREQVARDDLLLIRDRLCAAAAPSNGLQLVEELGAEDLGPIEDPDVRTFALTYTVRYLAQQAPGA